VSGGRIEAVVRGAAAKVDADAMHELTPAEWAAVRAVHRASVIEQLGRGRRPAPSRQDF
jgi:hypothetical protein